MKKGIALITLIAFLSVSNIVYAVNTKSIDLEESSSQSLSASDSASLDITTNVSIEFWAKPETVGGGDVHTLIIKGRDDAGTNTSVNYGVRYSSGKMSFYYYGAGWNIWNSTDSFSAGSWHHFAFTYTFGTAASLKFYVDGTEESGAWNASEGDEAVSGNSSKLIIGLIRVDDAPSEKYDGLIDEVRIWNDIRTQQEIEDNYLKELVGDETGLVFYAKLNDSLLDETANNNDLTNNNSATFSTDIPFPVTVEAKQEYFILFDNF